MFVHELGFIALLLSTLATNIIAGATGMLGGLILIALMVFWVDPLYLIPLHGAIQAGSAMSRTTLFFNYIKWKIVFYYCLGVIPGAFIGIQIFELLPSDIFLLLLAIFILLATWLPKIRPQRGGGTERYFIILGLITATLSMFLGVAGILVAPFFLRDDINKMELIATKGTCQGIVHLIKVPIFGLAGVNILVYWPILISLFVACFIGIWLGKKCLNFISDKLFFNTFKLLVTFVCIRIILIELNII